MGFAGRLHGLPHTTFLIVCDRVISWRDLQVFSRGEMEEARVYWLLVSLDTGPNSEEMEISILLEGKKGRGLEQGRALTEPAVLSSNAVASCTESL